MTAFCVLAPFKVKPGVVSLSRNTRGTDALATAGAAVVDVYAERAHGRVGSGVPLRQKRKKPRGLPPRQRVGVAVLAPVVGLPDGLPENTLGRVIRAYGSARPKLTSVRFSAPPAVSSRAHVAPRYANPPLGVGSSARFLARYRRPICVAYLPLKTYSALGNQRLW